MTGPRLAKDHARPGTRRTPVIGVLGVVASGKSAVARLMADGGGALIDADAIGHEVLGLPEVKQKLRAAFGEEIFTPEGGVSRERLGRHVFERRERLEKLNAIVHPVILEMIERQIRQRTAEGAAMLVLDAPLLMETGLHERYCDALVFVEADRAVRQARARASRGWNAEELAQREAAQIPSGRKMQQADFVIDNNGSPAELGKAVRALMQRIKNRLSNHGGASSCSGQEA